MRLKSFPPDAKVYDLFARRPDLFQPFVEVCEKIMRGPSPLSAGTRELLGTFVSALNGCPYCHDVHNEAVKAHGLAGELAQRAKDEIETAGLDEAEKPLFVLAKKCTEASWRVTDADFEAAYAAGWDDDAIEDTVLVACLFNFMNRLVTTLGIEVDPAGAGERIRDEGYAGSLDQALARQGKAD